MEKWFRQSPRCETLQRSKIPASIAVTPEQMPIDTPIKNKPSVIRGVTIPKKIIL